MDVEPPLEGAGAAVEDDADLAVVHLKETAFYHAEALGHMEDVASGVGDVAALKDAIRANDRLLDDGIVQRGHAAAAKGFQNDVVSLGTSLMIKVF